MRKVIVLVLTLVLTISSSSFSFASNAENENDYTTAYSYLISNGIPAEFLATMEKPDIIAMYDDLKDENIGNVTYETTELVINDDGQAVPLSSDLSSSDMTLSVTAITTTESINSGKGKILEVRPYITYVWKKKPAVRRNDAVTVNWTSKDFNYKAGTYSHARYRSLPDTNVFQLFSTITSATETNSQGFGINVEWPTSRYDKIKGIIKFQTKPQGVLYEYITPGDTSKNIYSSNVNVNYVHNGNPIAGLSFSKGGVGVSIGAGTLTYAVSKTATVEYAKK